MPERAEAGPRPRVERRLAAILAADVVGYSRLMGADEHGTLERLKRHRQELIEPKLAEHRGRLIKLMGDGALVEFASVVDAVQCAAEIQQAMAARNRAVREGESIAFRIGINSGDIIVEGDDIYGDGVRDRLDLGFDDLGEQEVKNISRPVRVYKVVLSPAVDPGKPRAAAPVPSLPDKPSVVVLAFQNMAGTPSRSTSRMASPKTSSPTCPRSRGCSSSPATRPSPTRAKRSTSSR